jgi:hypothetical protein
MDPFAAGVRRFGHSIQGCAQSLGCRGHLLSLGDSNHITGPTYVLNCL